MNDKVESHFEDGNAQEAIQNLVMKITSKKQKKRILEEENEQLQAIKEDQERDIRNTDLCLKNCQNLPLSGASIEKILEPFQSQISKLTADLETIGKLVDKYEVMVPHLMGLHKKYELEIAEITNKLKEKQNSMASQENSSALYQEKCVQLRELYEFQKDRMNVLHSQLASIAVEREKLDKKHRETVLEIGMPMLNSFLEHHEIQHSYSQEMLKQMLELFIEDYKETTSRNVDGDD